MKSSDTKDGINDIYMCLYIFMCVHICVIYIYLMNSWSQEVKLWEVKKSLSHVKSLYV